MLSYQDPYIYFIVIVKNNLITINLYAYISFKSSLFTFGIISILLFLSYTDSDYFP